MKDLYLVAKMAGTDVAISTHEVEAVISVAEIIPIPAAPDNVAGLYALRSRVVTLIDTGWTITHRKSPRPDYHTAIISSIGGHIYGFLTDGVEDVVTIRPEQVMGSGGVSDGWTDFAKGIVTLDDRGLVMVTLADFILPPRQIAA